MNRWNGMLYGSYCLLPGSPFMKLCVFSLETLLVAVWLEYLLYEVQQNTSKNKPDPNQACSCLVGMKTCSHMALYWISLTPLSLSASWCHVLTQVCDVHGPGHPRGVKENVNHQTRLTSPIAPWSITDAHVPIVAAFDGGQGSAWAPWQVCSYAAP